MTAQNASAGLFGRVRETWRFSLKLGIAYLMPAVMFALFLANRGVEAFTTDPAIIPPGSVCLQILVMGQFFATMAISGGLILIAMGRSAIATLMSLMHSIALPLTLLYFLQPRWGLTGVCWALSVADIAAAVLYTVVVYISIRNAERVYFNSE